jgi:hypothetical protein
MSEASGLFEKKLVLSLAEGKAANGLAHPEG